MARTIYEAEWKLDICPGLKELKNKLAQYAVMANLINNLAEKLGNYELWRKSAVFIMQTGDKLNKEMIQKLYYYAEAEWEYFLNINIQWSGCWAEIFNFLIMRHIIDFPLYFDLLPVKSYSDYCSCGKNTFWMCSNDEVNNIVAEQIRNEIWNLKCGT